MVAVLECERLVVLLRQTMVGLMRILRDRRSTTADLDGQIWPRVTWGIHATPNVEPKGMMYDFVA